VPSDVLTPLRRQFAADVAFLREMRIMDYSLLAMLHFPARPVADADGAVSDDPGSEVETSEEVEGGGEGAGGEGAGGEGAGGEGAGGEGGAEAAAAASDRARFALAAAGLRPPDGGGGAAGLGSAGLGSAGLGSVKGGGELREPVPSAGTLASLAPTVCAPRTLQERLVK